MSIEKAFCINLDARPDRWKESQAEFAKIGLDVERFSAVSGSNSLISFNLSQYAVLKKAVDANYEVFAVFEDDVVFDNDWTLVEEVLKAMPYGWDQLYLGCNITTDFFQKPERISTNLAKLRDCWQSHAIVYSKKGAQYILSQFKPDGEHWCIYDEWIRQNVLPHGNSYVLCPMIAYQRPSYSDIWQTQADYTGCHVQGNRTLLTL